ncbi:MAG: hypothetical protein GX536_00270 [Actinobacteria bacterium]|nr:hypothetical protein [Actinomycetota bacterium]
MYVIALIVSGAVVACGGVLGCGGGARGGDADAPSSVTANTAPSVSLAGHVEVGDTHDLGVVQEAKFASLMVWVDGGLRSFMVVAGEPEFIRLADAVSRAELVKETAVDDGSSLVFVLKDGTMISFGLDRDSRLLARAGQAWRLGEDFVEALVAVEERAP